jgi:hypothetical protein
MTENLSIEFKSDLEYMYKISGDLLNLLQSKDFKKENPETKRIIELIMFRLEDIGGVLQKDIFNCDYLILKMKTENELLGG